MARSYLLGDLVTVARYLLVVSFLILAHRCRYLVDLPGSARLAEVVIYEIVARYSLWVFSFPVTRYKLVVCFRLPAR